MWKDWGWGGGTGNKKWLGKYIKCQMAMGAWEKDKAYLVSDRGSLGEEGGPWDRFLEEIILLQVRAEECRAVYQGTPQLPPNPEERNTAPTNLMLS